MIQQSIILLNNNESYFAIKLTGPTPEKLLDPSYFSFHMYQSNYAKKNNNQGYSVNSTEIEFELWGDKFPLVQKEVYDRIGLSTYICPKNIDFYVRSNFNSESFQTIQISIDKCISSSWKSSTEIQNIMNYHSVDLAIISSYFDVNDYSNPIHQYLQDKNRYSLTSSVSQRVEYKVKQNQVFLSDSILFGSQGLSSEINFYSLDKGQIILSDSSSSYYLQFFIFLDQQIDQNQRTVYSFLDMLGYIGGIFGVLYKIGVVIVGIISQKIFYSSVLQNIFHDETLQTSKDQSNFSPNRIVKESIKWKFDENEEHKSSKVSSFMIEESKFSKKSIMNTRVDSKFESDKSNSSLNISRQYSFGNSEIDNHEIEMQWDQTNKIIRTPFEYSYKDIALEMFCLHRCKFNRQSCLTRKQRYNAFIDASKKFNLELDWISIIKSIRELKSMIELMMNDNQK